MKKIILTLLATCCLCQSQAQVLTLEQCRQTALNNNASLAAARFKSDQAYHTERQYFANFLPNFKLMGGGMFSTGSYNYNMMAAELPVSAYLMPYLQQAFPELAQQLATNPLIDLNIKNRFSYAGSVMLEQPIYMGGKITAAHKMAQLGQEMARHNEALSASDVIVRTDEAYVQCVKAQEMGKVAAQYNAMLQELLRVVESGHKNGMVPRNDVLRVQVKLNESELSLRKAENAQRLSRMNLCHVMGEPLTKSFEVGSDYPTIVPESHYVTTVENRPEFAILQKQVEIAGQQIKLQQSDFLPQVGAMASFGYMNALKLNDKKLINNTGFNALVTVTIPLFHFGEGLHKVKAAKAQRAVAEMQQRDLNEMMQLELAQAINNLDEAKLEVEVSQRSLAQADENVRMTKNRYEQGLSTLSEVMESQTLWQQAYESHVEARYQAYLMHSKYLKAAGLLMQQ